VFKSIRIRKFHFDRSDHSKNAIGHINYLRLLTKDYDYQKGDIFDERILRAAKSAFIDADLVYNKLLLLEGQLADCKLWTKGNLEQRVQTIISPEISYLELPNMVGKNFKEYHFNLKLHMQTIKTMSKSSMVDIKHVDLLNVQIPYLQIDNIVKTIEKL